jgi:hypothetical protein
MLAHGTVGALSGAKLGPHAASIINANPAHALRITPPYQTAHHGCFAQRAEAQSLIRRAIQG